MRAPRHSIPGAALFLGVALVAAACDSGKPAATGPAIAGPTSTNPASGRVLPPSGFALLGSWVTTVTKADFAAAGVTDPALQNENSGRFTWTFGPDGTWTVVQESIDGSLINNPVFRGGYIVAGDTLVVTTEFPSDNRDAGLHYTWTKDGSAVRFDVIDAPDPMLPVIVESHPWTPAS